jgi:hypothetical protein
VAGSYGVDTVYFGADTLVFTPNVIEGSTSFVLLAKYDPSGNPIWARVAGTHTDNTFSTNGFTDAASGVVTDDAGNVYIAGTYTSDSIFFDNRGIINYGSEGLSGTFRAKYSPSGTLIWAKGATGESSCAGIIIDQHDDIYITGSCNSLNTTFDSVILHSYGSIYVTKLGSSGRGIWVKGISGTARATTASGISTDASGASYITGGFPLGNCVFDNITLTPVGGYDMQVTKLSAAGTGLESPGGTAAIAVYPNPSNGNIVFTGLSMKNTIEIYDLMGQKVLTAEAHREAYPVNISGHNKGVYFYQVTDRGHTIQQGKIVLE